MIRHEHERKRSGVMVRGRDKSDERESEYEKKREGKK